MPFNYVHTEAGNFTVRSDTGADHSEGYVVYDTETNEEYGVFTTEEEARQCCAKLNDGATEV